MWNCTARGTGNAGEARCQLDSSPPAFLSRSCGMTVVDAAAAARQACGRALLLSLLERSEAEHLRACVRRLPVPPASPSVRRFAARVAAAYQCPDTARARLLHALGKPRLRVPDVEGAAAARCQLCRSTTGSRFRHRALQRHFASVFAAVAAHAPAVGLPVELSRYDLFHGHVFVAQGCVGLLMHAREYPALGPGFDVNLGLCQAGSSLAWDAKLQALRNVLYVVPARRDLSTSLAVLDTAEGTALHDLLAPGVRSLHTLYESDLGPALADVNYLHKAPRALPEHRLYVCV